MYICMYIYIYVYVYKSLHTLSSGIAERKLEVGQLPPSLGSPHLTLEAPPPPPLRPQHPTHHLTCPALT